MKESLYSRRSNLIIGFHGCDQTVVDKVLAGEENLLASTNDYMYKRETINYVKGEQIMTETFGHSKDLITLSLSLSLSDTHLQ